MHIIPLNVLLRQFVITVVRRGLGRREVGGPHLRVCGVPGLEVPGVPGVQVTRSDQGLVCTRHLPLYRVHHVHAFLSLPSFHIECCVLALLTSSHLLFASSIIKLSFNIRKLI